MSETTICPVSMEDDRIHQYVAGTLAGTDLEEFEVHLLGCAKCQVAVKEGITLRSALRRSGAGSARRRWLRWSAPLAAAAALVVWFVMGRAGPLDRLSRLETAPPFVGEPTRGGGDSISTQVDRGIARYGAGDYREAARLLGGAPDSDATPALQYYLGISRLMAGDTRGAIIALRQASRDPYKLYAADAEYFLAKAWLRLGRADSALAHLEKASVAEVPATRARLLADSVKEVMR